MVDETSVCLRTWKTELWLTVRARQTADLRRWLAATLRDEVAGLDLLASRFRQDSQLAAVNRAPGRWVEVDWGFVEVLTACLDDAAATDGLVNPLLGRHVVAAGYDTWAGQDSAIPAGTTTSKWEEIGVRPGRRQAQVRIPADSALDLGAVAKGWLADRLARIVHASSGYDCVANMGGDMRVISAGQPWTVAADPDRPDLEPLSLEVQDAGLATSGISHRTWTGGHHIIDPRSGMPARTPWSSVSAVAATAAGANTMSTAALILGEQGPEWVAAAGLDAWFVGSGRVVAVGRCDAAPIPA
jgi:thiamine biosynthesis lipoprotein